MAVTRSSVQKQIDDVVYVPDSSFPNGKLPVEKVVIQAMMDLLEKEEGKPQRSMPDAAKILSKRLIEHWNFCTVYTIKERHVVEKIIELYKEFKNNVQTRPGKRNDDWKQKMSQYNKRVTKTTFDISTSDKSRISKLEKEHGVDMGKNEDLFLEAQKSQKGYCASSTDKQWEKTKKRKLKEEKALEQQRVKEDERQSNNSTVAWDSLPDEYVSEDIVEGEESEYEVENESGESSKRKRRVYIPINDALDSMPQQWRHIRNSERVVKSEFYRAVDKLISKYHCSKLQAIASVIVVANELFGRNWKFHDEDQNVIDANTAPDRSKIRKAGDALQVLALKCVVEEMMEGDETVITFHDDGSKKKSVGSFMVQGVSIDNKFRAFPTLPVASESCENLASLKKTILHVLELCSGVSQADLMKKISFRMMDSTSHNFGVDEKVCLDLGIDHIPEELLCSTHPVLMFNREIVNVFSQIEKQIGREKLYSSVLVECTTSHDTVLEQYIDVFVRFISKEFSQKPWNYYKMFCKHIHPRKNFAKAFQKQRFNRFVYACALVVHHYDDVRSFLDKYEHVTNSLACIIRPFLEIEGLLIMAISAAVIGQHLVQPFLSLTYYQPVPYSELIPAGRQLYSDLIQTDAAQLIQLEMPAFKFTSEERYKECMWIPPIVDSLKTAVESNRAEVIQVIKLCLPQLAAGWFRQRGNVYGFGDYDQEGDKLLTKLDIGKLDKAPINNIPAERLVGAVNYELETKGPYLQTASSAIVKGKAYDLIELKAADEFRDYTSVVPKVNKVIENFKKEQEALLESGMSKQEIDNLKIDKRRLDDLEKLVNVGGPFRKSEQVRVYMESGLDEQTMAKRLSLEVRYHRDTCVSLPKSSDIFRIMRNYRLLPSDEYATNLMIYLDKVQANTSMTKDDFVSALSALNV